MEDYTVSAAFSAVDIDYDLSCVHVKSLSASTADRKITATLEIDKLIEFSMLENFRKSAISAYKLNELIFDIEFNLEESDTLAQMKFCIDVLCSRNSLWGAILNSCIVKEEETFTIFLRHGNRALLEEENADREIEKLYEKLFGEKKSVLFAEE